MSRVDSKVFDFVAHGIAVDKYVSRTFTASFMSNAKWRKFFEALDRIDNKNAVCNRDIQAIYKFVMSDNCTFRQSLPGINALSERYINGRCWIGPAYYKEIEWIEFPRTGKPYGMEKIPGAFFEQRIDFILNALNDIGRFQIEDTELGFRVYGYK